MSEITFSQAQANMRQSYFCGAPGVLVSGIVWLIAGLVAVGSSGKASVLALLIGGALIHPLGVVACKVLGRPGAHAVGNPLGRVAVEGTFWLLAGIAVAYGMHVLRLEWFFPAMLLLIGGRYLTFQSIYGLRVYWVLGAALCVVGLALGLARVAPQISALAGAALEIAFAVLIFRRSKSAA
jgi:hypothetical protein